MRTILSLFALAALPLSATAFTSSQTGDWSNSATWGGAGVPGAGDTVSIANGTTVTVSDTRIVGNSPAMNSGSPVIQLNTSGALIITGDLTVRGDTSYNTAGTTAGVTMQAGSGWHFDSHLATSPNSQHYRYGPLANSAVRAFVINGTSAQHVTVDSNAGGGAGVFSTQTTCGAQDNFYGAPFQAVYADFTRIGDGSCYGWTPYFLAAFGTEIFWDVTHSTFTSCGRIQVYGSINSSETFRHDNNVHVTAADTDTDLTMQGTDTNQPTAPILREMVGNVFSRQVCDTPTSCGAIFFFAWTGNYFPNVYNTITSSYNNTFSKNLFIFPSHPSGIQVPGTFSNNYIFDDGPTANPEILYPSTAGGLTISNNVYGKSGATTLDSGEFILTINNTVDTSYTVSGNILLPDSTGYSSLEMVTVEGQHNFFTYTNNTWFGGSSIEAPFGFADVNEGGGSFANTLTAKGNIMWNPNRVGYVPSVSFGKVSDVNHLSSGSLVTDVGAPSALDYNDGWNNIVSLPYGAGCCANIAAYTNQGNGYLAAWSATPGTHDISADPQFVDYVRSLELWDSKFLGNSATAWSGGASYAFGAFVSNVRADTYWSSTVNYRCIVLAGCSGGTNLEPGNDAASWRNDWEWASLYRIRTAIAAGATYFGLSPVAALNQWIRDGWRPTNSALAVAGAPNGYIGAVPLVDSPSGTGVLSGSAAISGAAVKH